MLKANISINLTKVKDNASYISTSKKGEKWANLEINVKDMVDNYGQNIKEGGATTQPKAATPFPTTDTLNDVADDLPF